MVRAKVRRHVTEDDDDSTLSDVRWDVSGGALLGRRLFLLFLLLLLLAGGTGLLGVHTTTVSASADGYTLTVTYARTARAGWDVPLRFDLTSTESLSDKKLQFTVDRAYLDMFETQGVNPEPSDENGDATRVGWEYDIPTPGTTFAVEYDAYIQPTAQIGTGSDISLAVNGEPVTSVHIETTLVP